jgi:hypothetical protein
LLLFVFELQLHRWINVVGFTSFFSPCLVHVFRILVVFMSLDWCKKTLQMVVLKHSQSTIIYVYPKISSHFGICKQLTNMLHFIDKLFSLKSSLNPLWTQNQRVL